MSSSKASRLSSTAAAGRSESPDVSTVAEPQETTRALSEVSLVIDSLKKKVDYDRCDYIKKRMEENQAKLAEATNNQYKLSVEGRKLGIINTEKTDNLLTKRQKEAIDMQSGVDICSGNKTQEDQHASVVLLGSSIAAKSYVRPINLPQVKKLPPYTTWIFTDRNQRMTEDQSVVGRRRIYYDQNGGEALICSDSEEDVIDEEEDKKEFVDSEDHIIRSTIEQLGSSDDVLDSLAQHLSRKPCEVKARYEALANRDNAEESSKPGVIDMNSFLDKDLESALDSFDNLFCRRCFIFDCKLHGCSQDLIYPAEKLGARTQTVEPTVPCGPRCYLQVQKQEGNAVTSPKQLKNERTSAIPSDGNDVLVSSEKSNSPSLRRRSKSCVTGSGSSNSRNFSESSDAETRPDPDMTRAHHSESPHKGKHARNSGNPQRSSKRIADVVKKRQRKVASESDPQVKEITGGDGARKKEEEVDETTCIQEVTDFKSWRTLEKDLFEKGIEIFGRNSCLITRNLLSPMKTCVEVFHALKSTENKQSSEGGDDTNSLEDGGRVDSNENTRLASRRRSGFLHRRGRVRRLKYSWKSAGYHSMRKRISDKKDRPCHQYNPCGCQSNCGNDCSCLANQTCCEKYCGCPKTCKIRFRGCHCAKSQCRSRQCPCFAADRECDPDVCRNCWISCGDGSLGCPSPKGDNHECRNMKLLLKQQQRVLLGRSDVSGWGAFLKNGVPKHEYLGEYTGELVSHHEADKRGKIYDRENSSFLFNLNDQFVLDAYRKGDKLKFANHSPDPNCYAKVMMVGGDHRVGIYAKERINAGEELFYDYRYEPDRAPAWAKKPEASGSKKDDAGPSNGRAKKLA